MARIAIIGTGVSGLVSAHLLHPHHEITVYEANDRLGGHTHTHEVSDGVRAHNVDTGFIVFNDRNYPNFERVIMEGLGLEANKSHMSFSVSDRGGDFEYSGAPGGIFAQRSNLVDRRFLRMLRDLTRFNRACKELIASGGEGPSLAEFLREGSYSDYFIERLIVPQAAAVWSADPAQMWSFPASFLARFFDNHGILELRNRPVWKTVKGGSSAYIDVISAPWRDRIRLCAPVRRIERSVDGVRVEADGCETEVFDEVVIAAHADQALNMLGNPTQAEHEILGAIPYQDNEAVLHTDTSLMPKRRKAWSSWNYHLPADPSAGLVPGGEGRSTVTYWMNHLQRLDAACEFLVTLNLTERIDPAKVLSVNRYAHPVFTREGVAGQARHGEISGSATRTRYCGAYWSWGFHEDGVLSAIRACEGLLGERSEASPALETVAA